MKVTMGVSGRIVGGSRRFGSSGVSWSNFNCSLFILIMSVEIVRVMGNHHRNSSVHSSVKKPNANVHTNVNVGIGSGNNSSVNDDSNANANTKYNIPSTSPRHDHLEIQRNSDDLTPVPTKPGNVSLLWVTDSMLELSWTEPSKPNGKLEGYRIYYMQNNFTGVVTVKEAMPQMKFALPDLEAYTEYKIWVKAFTWKNEGDPSETIVVRTDVRGPSPPKILNVSCLAEDALYIQWSRPTKFYNTIDFYYVDYRSEEWRDFEEVAVSARFDLLDQAIFLPNLTTNVMYEVRVRGGTRSVFETEKVYKGQVSDSRKILMQPNCEKARLTYNLPRASNEFTPTMVAISVCASFALFLLLVAVVVWRRCFQGEYYYLDDPFRVNVGGLGWEGDSGDELKRATPAHLFPKHVAELHVDSDIGFSKEYEAIQASCVQEEFAAELSQHPENKQKNRYLNIVAYDHSRVRLQPLPGQKKNVEYINGNYIDGFRKAHAYIGTQGPLPSTFEIFWRMVWDNDVHIIVMITNLVERGRKKCDQYWPKEGMETYGVIQVRLVKEDVCATYTVRTFVIRHIKLKKQKKKKQMSCERTVYHYHYTNWPDHLTPSHPLPVLSFVKKSAAANPPDAGPIIVHCSAGVGRTGTYIVLDTMLRQIRARGDLNVFSFLNHIRSQRNFLVQTEEQYIFIHDALVEAIESGETSVSVNYLPRYVQNLLPTGGSYADEKSEVSSLLEIQYKLVTQFTPQEFHLAAAMKPFNLTKNRNLDCVCTDAYRVLLTPKPGTEGSDYINASFFPGFHRLQEFVVTQHPFESTTMEFWRMLWDHNIQTVVVLSAVDDQEYPRFWPTIGEDLDLDQTCRVKLLQESDRVGFVLRDFSIQSLQDDYELHVKMIQCSHWPHHCSSMHMQNNMNMGMHSPSASSASVSVFDLIQLVQESVRDNNTNTNSSNPNLGPIAVMDRFGGLEAATFVTLTTLYKQMMVEGQVDVYMYAKLYHEQRPGIWKTLEDFLFLYRCVEFIAATAIVQNGNGNNMNGNGGENGSICCGGMTGGNANLNTGSPSPLMPPPNGMTMADSFHRQMETMVTANGPVILNNIHPNGHANGQLVVNQNGNVRLPGNSIEILDNPSEPIV